jgi:hypothetical protein
LIGDVRQDHCAKLKRSSARIEAVFVTIVGDQAGGGYAHRLLDETGERSEKRHQADALFVEHLSDRLVAELGMLRAFGVCDALVRQHAFKLVESLHLRSRSEHDVSDLVLDLALFRDPCEPRQGGRLQIGIPPGFELECKAGIVGTLTQAKPGIL